MSASALADEHLVAFLKVWARVAAGIVIAVPCVVLAGWLLEIETLTRVLPGLVAMNPLTAILFILLGIGLACARRGDPADGIAESCAAVVAITGALVLCRYLFGWSVDVDRWLFPERLAGNVMAPTTAFNFLFSGLALALCVAPHPRALVAAQLCAIIATIYSVLAFTGYMYGIERLYRLSTFIAMAVHTATSFVVFATGLLALEPGQGLMARCTSARAGGVMLRRLLLPTLLIPPLLGWLILLGHHAGWWESALGFTLLVMAMILFVATLVWRNAQGLDREDARRLESDARLREAHAGLERNIAERTADLRQAIAGVREGLEVLALSTEEILDASSHLAASANDAASAATETTATVEEVRQTTQLATRGAQRVAECARAAAEMSGAGTSATRSTADGMEHVRGEMRMISERMAELTSQTQAIGAIIAAVDQIATQSNLLSVNAAIEAARAGEKGKGFAVVADEVRYLSDQSRDATRQVRGILGEIQRATGAAVMTTEQAAAAVETGATQAARAGESILGLEARVAEAAQVATEIASSSHEQALGMEHVATAMDRIKGTTRDNLREAQRLEGAARRLHTLGQQLKELAERHRG